MHRDNGSELQDVQEQSRVDYLHGNDNPLSTSATIAASNQIKIQLLAERLITTQRKQKVGEVVIRKEVEMDIVEVPVKREKLIVEQISPNYQKIADITPEMLRTDPQSLTQTGIEETMFLGQFLSPQTASEFLKTIAELTQDACEQIQVTIKLRDGKLKDTYEYWLQHFS